MCLLASNGSQWIKVRIVFVYLSGSGWFVFCSVLVVISLQLDLLISQPKPDEFCQKPSTTSQVSLAFVLSDVRNQLASKTSETQIQFGHSSLRKLELICNCNRNPMAMLSKPGIGFVWLCVSKGQSRLSEPLRPSSYARIKDRSSDGQTASQRIR